MRLRYGTNPDQTATCSLDAPGSPLAVVAGEPSLINVLDAINAWQLVHEASAALGRPAATSFKHVSPAGAAAVGPVDDTMLETWDLDRGELSPIAMAYVRARDCDPKSSFSDMVAVSDAVDLPLARVLATMISDGIVAPGYEPGVIDVLSAKKGGRFLVLEADAAFVPPPIERREVFGVALEQTAARTPITCDAIAAAADEGLPGSVVDDLVLAMITARYTQSNSVAYARDGVVFGIGAGQQSRVDCTAIAGAKVDTWWLRRHPTIRAIPFGPDVKRQDRINWRLRCIAGDLSPSETDELNQAIEGGQPPRPLDDCERRQWLEALDGISLASDGLIPFRDNIDVAATHGVRFIAEPGGSSRNHEVDRAANEHDITVVRTGIRLFHH